MIGICTRYDRHEAAYAAIQLANWLEANNQQVQLFTVTGNRSNISPRWDRRVMRISEDYLFMDMVRRCRHIVWTTIPTPLPLYWAKEHDIRTTLLVTQAVEFETEAESLSLATTCLCPNYTISATLREWGAGSLVTVPWDCGEPFFVKPETHRPKPRILLPLYDGNSRRTEVTAIRLLERVLQRHPTVHCTVAYNASTMAARGTRLLRELRRTYGERITLFRGIRPDQHAALYRQHDLTLWPTHFETLCLVGLLSLAAGTPVMTFNSAPVAELLNSDNAIIVEPEAVVVEKYMLPYVVPDYAMMDEMLYLIAKDPDYLHTLQRTVLHGLDERRNLFQQKMSQIFLTG